MSIGTLTFYLKTTFSLIMSWVICHYFLRSIHWILGVVHLSVRRIYIYDSLRSLNKPNQLKELVTSLTMLLPRLLNIVKYYGDNVSARRIYIYDSLRSRNKPNQLKKLVIYLTMLLSRLLDIVKYYGDNGDPKGDMT